MCGHIFSCCVFFEGSFAVLFHNCYGLFCGCSICAFSVIQRNEFGFPGRGVLWREECCLSVQGLISLCLALRHCFFPLCLWKPSLVWKILPLQSSEAPITLRAPRRTAAFLWGISLLLRKDVLSEVSSPWVPSVAWSPPSSSPRRVASSLSALLLVPLRVWSSSSGSEYSLLTAWSSASLTPLCSPPYSLPYPYGFPLRICSLLLLLATCMYF